MTRGTGAVTCGYPRVKVQCLLDILQHIQVTQASIQPTQEPAIRRCNGLMGPFSHAQFTATASFRSSGSTPMPLSQSRSKEPAVPKSVPKHIYLLVSCFVSDQSVSV